MYHNSIFIDTKNKYKLIPKKSKAGNEAQSPSFTFSLTNTPRNINKDNPPDESIKIVLNFKPISKPVAPKISKMAVNTPNFFNPKRINSLFIFGFVK